MNEYKRKCGVVTFHSSYNYGSVLQAYAMIKTLQSLNLDAEIVDFRHPHTTDVYQWKFWSPYKSILDNIKDLLICEILGLGKKREFFFGAFIEKMLPKSNVINAIQDIPCYDVLVCGSDQIWNPFATGENNPIYFLDFDNTEYKFSYAASSGTIKFGDGCKEIMFRRLNSLKSIGVREDFMKSYIKEEFGLTAVVNPDPTLLLDTSQWSSMEVEYPGLPKDFLLVYALSGIKEILEFSKKVAGELGLPLVHICVDRGVRALFHNGIKYSLIDVSPQQFLWLFNHAEFIVTNTFHGNVFSIIFRKKFIYYSKSYSDSRILTLHKAIGLDKSRLVCNMNEFKRLDKHINYKGLETFINDYRKQGVDYIIDNISY